MYLPTSYVNTKSEITLSAHDCRGNILSETDEQNVALHELGHCLGLGHSNYTDDLMYYAYSLGGSVRAISTLDAVGVGTVFRWMANSQEYRTDNQGQQIYSVSLASAEYEYQPISEENLPPQSPLEKAKGFLEDFVQFLSQPDGWAVIIALAFSATIAFLTIARIRKRRKFSKQS
jgi:hypothetical protein